MIFFNTLKFCAVLAASIAGFHAIRHFFPKINRPFLLFILSAMLSMQFFKIPFTILGILFGFSAAFYFAVERLRHKGFIAFSGLLAAIVLAWVALKFPHSFPRFHRIHDYFIPAIGIPYIFCRLISYAVDRRKDLIQEPHFFTFLVYVFYFPALLSGPVTRYQQFSAEPQRGIDYQENYLVPGLKRIIIGLLKKNLVGPILSAAALPNLSIHDASVWRLIAGLYFYYFYLYLDFSGYMDLIIGTSRLLKVDLPENFNFPFIARNLRDFWARWHMSLTAWLNDYIFTPLYTWFLRTFSTTSRTLLGAWAIFITFLFAGVWHGDALRYLSYGAYNSVGLFGFKLIDDYMKKNHARLKKKLKDSRVAYGLSATLTFHYVLIGFMIFSLDFEKIRLVGHRIGMGIWGGGTP